MILTKAEKEMLVLLTVFYSVAQAYSDSSITSCLREDGLLRTCRPPQRRGSPAAKITATTRRESFGGSANYNFGLQWNARRTDVARQPWRSNRADLGQYAQRTYESALPRATCLAIGRCRQCLSRGGSWRNCRVRDRHSARSSSGNVLVSLPSTPSLLQTSIRGIVRSDYY